MNYKLTIASLIASTGLINASTINVAFHNGGATVGAFDTAVDGTVVSTGANGTDTWNNIQNNGGVGLSFSLTSLLFEDGTTSGVSLAGNSGFSGFSGSDFSNDDVVLLDGFYGFGGTESLTFGGLTGDFSNGYSVTIFGDSSANDGRVMGFTIGSETQSITDNATFDGTFTEGLDFVTFDNISGETFTITGNATGFRSSISGIVVTAVPEPSSAALLGLGGLTLLLRRRK